MEKLQVVRARIGRF